MTRCKYIVVEGPIGVGKTSLAKILANEFQARTVFERIEDNPFLPKFYKSRETFAFQNQTFFLLNRYQQQMELGQQDLFSQGTVADYLFAKDQIFASITLSAEELNLYQQIYALLNTRIPKPDLVVYLQAPGKVARCPSCGSIVMVVAEVRGINCVDLRGLAALEPHA